MTYKGGGLCGFIGRICSGGSWMFEKMTYKMVCFCLFIGQLHGARIRICGTGAGSDL